MHTCCAWATLPIYTLILRLLKRHQITSSRLQTETEGARYSFSSLNFFFFFFFYLLSMKSLSCLRSSPRSQANQKCRDLHRPWSASPLFGLKWSCNRWSYFKALAAACPVLPISLSGNTESLIYCLAALLQPSSPFLLSVRTHKASLPRSIHLQMAYLLYREGTKYQ